MSPAPPLSVVTFPSWIEPRSELELLRRSLMTNSRNDPPSDSDGETKDVDVDARLKLFRNYLLGKDDAWVLDAAWVAWLGRVLHSSATPPRDKAKLLRLLAHCSLKDDFSVLLSNDRKRRWLMNYVSQFASLGGDEQKAVGLFLCHVSSRLAGRQWLLYGSTWSDEGGRDTCNAQVSVRVAKQCLMHAYNPDIRQCGLGAIYNMSLFKQNPPSVPTPQEEPQLPLPPGGVTKAQEELAEDLSQGLEQFLKQRAGKEGVTRQQQQLCDSARENFSLILSEVTIIEMMEKEANLSAT